MLRVLREDMRVLVQIDVINEFIDFCPNFDVIPGNSTCG
jgi:hypothetical protein